ncbi:MAG: pyridoxal phosphate-dependent aminotransferase [Thermoanaerobaculia bacterium]
MPRYPDIAPSVAAVRGSVYSALARRPASGVEPIPLHIGDTWMEPPEGCRMEDLRVEEHPGMHRYAPVAGLPALLSAIATHHGGRTGVDTSTGQVLVAAGATGALGAAAGALLEPGDEVLLAAPYWPLIAGIVRSFHGVPVDVPLVGEATSAAEAVVRFEALRTERTVAVYWNTPHNPTGRLLPRDWIEALVDWARSRELWILADDVYEDYVYDGEHTYTRPLARERTVSVHSFSKAYGMAGNRCGYLVAPEEAVAAMRKVATHTFYSTPTAAQLAALNALNGAGDPWVAAACEKYAALGRMAAERLGVEPPQGSTFLFLDVGDAAGEDGLAGFLAVCAERGVLLAPGPSFGPYPHHARLCFTAAPPDQVERGVTILAELLGRST